MNDNDAQKIADLISRKTDSETQKSIGNLEGKMQSVMSDIGEIKETNIRIFKRLDYTAKKNRCEGNEKKISEIKEKIDTVEGGAGAVNWIIHIFLLAWMAVLTLLEIFKDKLHRIFG